MWWWITGILISLLGGCTAAQVTKRATLPPATQKSSTPDTLAIATAEVVPAKAAAPSSMAALPYAPVLHRLRESGISSDFLHLLATHPSIRFDEKFTRINVLGTAKKPDYSHFYRAAAVRRCVDFLRQHDSLLTAVEQLYRVPKEVIVAILFVETKLGTYTGKHHVPSVFLSIAMANAPQYIAKNRAQLRRQFQGSPQELVRLERKLEKRAQRKAQWALQELKALEQIYYRHGIDVFSLYGSWAGAFGYAQFLPSSFLRWGVDGNQDGIVDLFTFSDAAHSIAFYLRSNGWNSTQAAQRKAIYAYNHSRDYVNAVLTLARKIRRQYQRHRM